MLKEFKEFAIRGNVVDMTVGIIVGAAFGKIVNSFVTNIIMPPLGWLTGKIDLTNLFFTLSGGSYATLDDAKKAGAVTINYGLVLDEIISFTIIAFIVFLMVRQINRFKREEDTSSIAPTQKSCPYCYTSISIKATRCPHCTSELATLL